MCTTLFFGKKMTESPSVWPEGKCSARMSSPFRCTVTSCSKVIIGSAAFSAGLLSLLIEPPADVILRNERGAGVVKRDVSAGVVSVIVRVDGEAHRLVRDAKIFERGLDFFRQRRELVVHDDDAVFAHGSADVAAFAFQHVDVAGNLGYFDLNLGPVRCLLCRGSRPANQRCANQCKNHPSPYLIAHHAPPKEAEGHTITGICGR